MTPRLSDAAPGEAHMSGSRENEHVITMRRPRAGIRLPVIHLESMTQLLPMVMRGRASGRVSPRCRSSTQASSCSTFLTRRRPTARHPAGTQASSSDRKLISGKVLASRKPGPTSNRSSTGEPVLTAPDLATRRAVESSTGSAISTRPVRGRRPRTGRPATRAAKAAYECAGSTRQLPTASRGGPPGASWMRDVVVTASPWLAGSAGRRRQGPAPCAPRDLGFSQRCGRRTLNEGPDFLGDGAPVGGGGQLAEHREQAEVDALEDHVGLGDAEVAGDRAAQIEEAAHDRGRVVAGDGPRPWFADGVVEHGQVLDDLL